MRFDREMDSKVDSKRAGEFWFQTGMLAVHFTVHPTAVTNISQCKVCAKIPFRHSRARTPRGEQLTYKSLPRNRYINAMSSKTAIPAFLSTPSAGGSKKSQSFEPKNIGFTNDRRLRTTVSFTSRNCVTIKGFGTTISPPRAGNRRNRRCVSLRGRGPTAFADSRLRAQPVCWGGEPKSGH